MKVIILAAGYGTRLYPLTLHTPKGLLDIGRRKLIDFIIEKLNILQVGRVFVVTNNRFYGAFLRWVKECSLFSIEIINDGSNSPEERLGALGDIELVIEKKRIVEDILVLGSDNIFTWDLEEFITFSRKKKSVCIGLYDVGDRELARRFGIAEIDDNFRLISFEEKPSTPKSTLAGTCIYFFPAHTLKYIREYTSSGYNKDTSGQYISWLREKISIFGFKFEGDWLDIGQKDTLELARKFFS